MTTRRERKYNAVHQRIIPAVLGLCAAYRLNIVTGWDIAARAETSRKTVYYHFRDKAEMLCEAVEYECKRVLDTLRIAIADEPTAAAKAEKFAKMIHHEAIYLTRIRYINIDFVRSIERLGKSYAQFSADKRKLLADILRFGNESGEFSKNFAHDDVADTLVTAFDGLDTMYMKYGMDDFEVRDRCLALVEAILNGLVEKRQQDSYYSFDEG